MKETSKIIIQVESKFHKMLKMKALEKEGMTLGHIIQAPMEGLIAFHTGKI